MNRRTLLKGAALTSASLLLEGCAARRVRPVAAAVPPPIDLAKVLVSPEREIRTTVCLRPFRPSGFRLEPQKLDDKLCVHNYGHGGAGITLSWGTAQLAASEILASGQRQVAVLGCGVVGLATARTLQQMGKAVTIYAKAIPPETTSNSAGGFWFPVTVFDRGHEAPLFQQQFPRAVRLSYTYFQQFVGEDYSVRWLPTYYLNEHPFNETGMVGPKGPFADFEPGARDLQPQQHRFPAAFVREFKSMLIEPHHYLRALVRDFQAAGGCILVREFRDVAEISALPERAIVNCTGLGAKSLFSDPDLVPIKGQLTFLLPQPEVNYNLIAGELYMFPRRDGIVLGGTHGRGEWSLEPDLNAKARILEGHARLFSGL